MRRFLIFCCVGMLFSVAFLKSDEIFAVSKHTANNLQLGENNFSSPMDVEVSGLENQQFLTGEVFYIRRGVQIIVNGEELAPTKIRVYATNGLDISGIDSVVLQHPGTYIYTYEYEDSMQQLQSQKRTITVVNPYRTTVASKKKSDRDMSILYTIKNEYQTNVTLLMQDWALFPIYHDEKIGELKVGEELAYEKDFEVVPVFEKSDDMPSAPVNGNFFDNPDYSTLYTKTGILGFHPTFEFRNQETNERLSRFSLETTLDMSNLVEEKKILVDQIDIRTFIPEKKWLIGEEATLVYEILNNTSSSYYVKVSDWDYFEKHEKVELGLAKNGEKTTFTKTIVVTPELMNESGQLKDSMNSLYFSKDDREEFVINNMNQIQKQVPDAPYVNPVTDIDTIVTGIGEENATIKISNGGTIIGVGEADKEGVFGIAISRQEQGTRLSITQITESGESTPTEITVSKTEVINEIKSTFKLGYWQNYGLVLEGQISNETWDLSSMAGLQGSLQLINEDGIIKQSSEVQLTNWYDRAQYNGYQGIIDMQMVDSLNAASELYELRIVLLQNGTELANEAIELQGFVGRSGLLQNFTSDFLALPSNHIGTSFLTTESKNQTAYLKIEKQDTAIMGLISEAHIEEGRAVNGYILNADFDFSKEHQKNVIIETKTGEEVKVLENVHTWDLSDWGLGVNLDMRSGFQVIIPTEYANPALYQYTMTITELDDLETEHVRLLLDKII